MNQSHLAACPSCSRHVRVSETACPFCRVSLSDAFRATPPREGPRARLSRAALFAFGAGTVALTPACSSTSSPPGGGGVEEGDGSAVVQTDGATGGTASDSGAGGGSFQDAPTAQPLYGAVAAYGAPAPTPDAGGTTTTPPVDAGTMSEHDGGITAQPLYGAVAAYGSPGI